MLAILYRRPSGNPVTSSATSNDSTKGFRLRAQRAALAVLLFAAVLAVAVWGALRVGDIERSRDLRVWQNRLAIVADSRFTEIGKWIERQFDELSALATNTSVQLYMTQLALAATVPGGQAATPARPDAALASYLRNLLMVTAERTRFTAPLEGPDVPANVRRIGVAGLALLDRGGNILAATSALPPIEGELRTFVADLPRDRRALFDFHRNAAGRPAMGFAVPIHALQGDAAGARHIGWILGLKEVADEIYPLLRQPGEIHKSAENLLVRRRGAQIDFLSPLADGTPPLSLALAASTPDLAEADAVATPGGFAEGRDHGDAAVLYVSRAFTTAPWTLVAKIDRTEALAASNSRRTQLIVVFSLGVVLFAALLGAAWWYGASRQARLDARRYRSLAERHAQQGTFLKLVADTQPTAIFILDDDGRYGFANEEAAHIAGLALDDLVGKPIGNVLGPEAARPHLAHAARARESGQRQRATLVLGDGPRTKTLQVDYVPLESTDSAPDGVLVVERDVTAELTERAKRERALIDLVRTLVALVDRRDPYAADHSTRVATVAQAIAREMGLGETAAQTVDFAGRLMNLGKILVPAELLTRAGHLNEEEIGRVRESLLATADFLDGIDFGGPVVETLRQLYERWDGQGKPRGLSGDAILAEARIVAVANAFVAMASPRAYRAGIGVDRAMANLREQAGQAFDRRAVTALENVLENRGGREAWAVFGQAAVPRHPAA